MVELREIFCALLACDDEPLLGCFLEAELSLLVFLKHYRSIDFFLVYSYTHNIVLLPKDMYADLPRFDRETPGMRHHPPVPWFYIQFSR